jgi:2-dehydro-3-deoxygluconokinase
VSGLVTFGETMALVTSLDIGPLRHATRLGLGVAGSESNVAIGVRRLGQAAAWMGRVGDDELGRMVVARLRGEDIDVAAATVDAEAPTGLMLKAARTAGTVRVTYYRTGSAGSRLAPGHLDEARIRAAGVLHLTGITAALSTSARAAVFAASETARGAGVPVSLDPNHRAALWKTEEAVPVLRDLAAHADVVIAGAAEARLLVDAEEPSQAAEAIHRAWGCDAIVTLGADGAVAVLDGVAHRVPAVPVDVVDPVGAGDGFCAGYLAGLLEGEGAAERLRTAAAVGAFAVTTHGDWEGLPARAELEGLTAGGDAVTR